MQEVSNFDCRSVSLFNALCQLRPVLSILLPGLLFIGCGAGEDGTSHAVPSPTSNVAPQHASSGPSRLAANNTLLNADRSSAPTVPDATAAAAELASLAQLNGLPHLSALSPREKMGLLLLLPSKSSSQRLALIQMYPSLSQLPVVQKQVLLDKLEKIVPVADSQQR